ncbi:MAG TPA: hypothetical protein VK037_08070 [Pseudogracilibacillus sp.]|nr:hypothetical protein [Pseudogracilibacillus sp.]
MWNSRGFIWVETLLSLQIVLILAITIMPLYSKITTEKDLLHKRTMYSLALYNELKEVVYKKGMGSYFYEKEIDSSVVTFHFFDESPYIKGCISWTNAKDKKENLCLYRLQK